MRYRDAAAYARRTKLLALQQFGEETNRCNIRNQSGSARELLQKCLLVSGSEVDGDVGRCKEIRNFHGGITSIHSGARNR